MKLLIATIFIGLLGVLTAQPVDKHADKITMKSSDKLDDKNGEKTEHYTDKYDGIDVDQILHNDRLLNNYVACLKGNGKCSPDGAELKKLLPEALQNGCAKCTEKQKSNSKKVIDYLSNKKPEIWKELEHKYDPDGKYKNKYKTEAQKEGIKV